MPSLLEKGVIGAVAAAVVVIKAAALDGDVAVVVNVAATNDTKETDMRSRVVRPKIFYYQGNQGSYILPRQHTQFNNNMLCAFRTA